MEHLTSESSSHLFPPRPRIISVSRRTDIPAFHSAWFMERLREGSVTVRHPYSRKESVVSLKPEDVYGFVFWSRNYAPLLPHLDEIEKVSRRLFFHFTVTGLPCDLETNTPDSIDAVRDFRHLSRRYSPAHLIWRFDPLCVTDNISFDDIRRNFIRIARGFEGSCTACYTSFVHHYRKTITNVRDQSDHRLVELSDEEKRLFAGELGRTALEHGITLHACCNDILLQDTVQKGACIDENRLAALWGDPVPGVAAAPTRKQCSCTRSVDIGTYGTCAHGCLYCYAS